MTPYELKVVRRIVKVNQAGEAGAINIYKGQLKFGRNINPQVLSFLKQTLKHEISHYELFSEKVFSFGARPCAFNFVWRWGGWIMGTLTGLLGEKPVMVCTMAVERTVHKHLVDQVAFLEEVDKGLQKLVLNIQTEELGHLEFAEKRLVGKGVFLSSLEKIISLIVNILIFLSTSGQWIQRIPRNLA